MSKEKSEPIRARFFTSMSFKKNRSVRISYLIAGASDPVQPPIEGTIMPIPKSAAYIVTMSDRQL
jgi:hypothetical protein